MIKESHPCKIVETSTSKTGKHGSAKVHFVGLDIFTGKKYETIADSKENVTVPDLEKDDLLLTEIKSDGTLVLTGHDAQVETGIKLPEGDLGTNITNAKKSGKVIVVSVLSCMGKKKVVAYHEKKVRAKWGPPRVDVDE